MIRSPQFTGSLRSFGNALRSGQLGPLLMHLGLKDGMNVVSVRSFIEAIHNQHYKDESTMDESK